MFGSGPGGPDPVPGWSGEVPEAMGSPLSHASGSHTAHVSLVQYGARTEKKITRLANLDSQDNL